MDASHAGVLIRLIYVNTSTTLTTTSRLTQRQGIFTMGPNLREILHVDSKVLPLHQITNQRTIEKPNTCMTTNNKKTSREL